MTGLVITGDPGTVIGGAVVGLATGTGEYTGFVEGTVMGVVEGRGLNGATVTGFVDGTVTTVGVGIYGVVDTGGVVDMGVVGKIVGDESNASCEVVLRWGFLESSRREEGKICSSSLFISFCAKSSMEDTCAYRPTMLLVI